MKKRLQNKWGQIKLAYNPINYKTRKVRIIVPKAQLLLSNNLNKNSKISKTLLQKNQKMNRDRRNIRYPKAYAMVNNLQISGLLPIKHYKLRKNDQWKAEFLTKQAIKNFYGNIKQKQLVLAIRKARKNNYNIINWLEKRLDVLLVRSYLAQSIDQARYLIRHGFIYVNNQTITYPHYIVKPASIIKSTHPQAALIYFKAKSLSKILKMTSSMSQLKDKKRIEKPNTYLEPKLRTLKQMLTKTDLPNILKTHNKKNIGNYIQNQNYNKMIYVRDPRLSEIKQTVTLKMSKLREYVQKIK